MPTLKTARSATSCSKAAHRTHYECLLRRLLDCFTAELRGCEVWIRLSLNHNLQARIGFDLVDYTGGESAYFRQIEEFLKAVEGNTQRLVRSSYQDSVKTLAATVPANRSLVTGTPEKVTII
jgi:hypothetical protein